MARAQINPKTNSLHVTGRGGWDEDIEVTVPAKGAVSKVDVYFLADTTSSMGPVIAAVKSGTEDIVEGLVRKSDEVGADLCFGVGNYRDLDYDSSEWFRHQQSITSDVGNIENSINDWQSASTGEDVPEGQFYALDQIARRSDLIGWRPGAKRVLVWIGDAPGHDPICAVINGLGHDITEPSVTEKLKEEQIFVVSISTPSGGSGPGLNVDPTRHGNSDTYAPCGDAGGSEGQAQRIAGATGGEADDGIRPHEVVDTILRLGGAQIQTVHNISLVPDKKIKPFVSSIDPAAGYGPFSAFEQRTLAYNVSFSGVSGESVPNGKSATEELRGSLDVIADNKEPIGRKRVTVSVPDLSGKYKIQCTQNDQLLQMENPAYGGDGANVNYGVDTSSAHQQWELIPATGGGYYIKNLDPRKDRYLEVAGQSTENRAEILTRESTSGQHKQWRFVPTGVDDHGVVLYKIQNLKTGKVIDAQNANRPDLADKRRTRAIQYHYWGDHPEFQIKHNQHWRLLPL